MAEHTPRNMTIPCAQCGRAAAEIALLPAAIQNPDLWHNRDRLERTDFLTRAVRFARYEKLEDLYEAIRSGNYELAHQLDPEFIGFICAACGVAYCEACWQINVLDYEDGTFDHATGICPHGHRQRMDE